MPLLIFKQPHKMRKPKLQVGDICLYNECYWMVTDMDNPNNSRQAVWVDLKTGRTRFGDKDFETDIVCDAELHVPE